jgi:hypothetical protein
VSSELGFDVCHRVTLSYCHFNASTGKDMINHQLSGVTMNTNGYQSIPMDTLFSHNLMFILGFLGIWQNMARMRVLQTSAEPVAFPCDCEGRLFSALKLGPGQIWSKQRSAKTCGQFDITNIFQQASDHFPNLLSSKQQRSFIHTILNTITPRAPSL